MFAIIVAALAYGDDLDALIQKLGADDVDAREAATVELKSKGKAVEPRLRDALKTADDPEIAARLGVVLDYLSNVIEAETVCVFVHPEHVRAEQLGAAFLDKERTRWKDLGEAAPSYPVETLVRTRQGEVACFIVGRPRVVYHKSRPQELLAPFLRAQLLEPVATDLPPAFGVLIMAGGFPEFIPLLEERAKKSSDPLVRRLCERAIEKQKEVPCSTSP